MSIIILLVGECAYSEVQKNNELIRRDGSYIQYYLDKNLPQSGSEYLLIILQGSDCNSIKCNIAVKRLRNTFAQADFLTIEKYGITADLEYSSDPQRIDCPISYLENDCPEQRVDDAKKVIKQLVKTYNYKKIIIIGGSEGAVVAGMLSTTFPNIIGTILIGAGGRWFVDDIIYSLQYTTGSQGELIKKTDEIKKFEKYMISAKPFWLSASNHGFKWWKNMFKIDQQENLKLIKTPLLILQGGIDKSVSPSKNAEMIEYLKKIGKKNIDYIFYNDLDHSLNISTGDENTNQVLIDISTWIERICR
jgi:esterase/lipase